MNRVIFTLILLVGLVGAAFAAKGTDSSGWLGKAGTDKHSAINTEAVYAQMNKLYDSARPSYMGMNKFEHSFTVNKDGSVTDITTSKTDKSNAVTVTPGTTDAIIHTHPYGGDPHPSPGDFDVAKTAGCPNYELSRDELWVANPDGTQAKVGDVSWKHGEIVIKPVK